MDEFTFGFDLAGGWVLAAARLASLAAILSTFGTLLFAVVVAPPALARAAEDAAARLRRALRRLAAGSLAVALPALLTWLVLEVEELTGRTDLAAIRGVLTLTLFGHVMGAEIGLSAVTALALGISRRPLLPAVPATLATVMLAGQSHAFAMEDGVSPLLGGHIVHLLAAGAWLGGLMPLYVAVWLLPPSVGVQAARYFTPLGKACVVAVLATAAWQFWSLVGGLPGLVGTAYGWIVGLKLALFGVLFGFAVLNRYWLAPALRGPQPEAARRALLASIAGQTGLGLATLAAAAVLNAVSPAIHQEPVWPFGLRPSLVAFAVPESRREVMPALASLGLGCGFATWAALRRRRRWAWVAAAALCFGFAAPRLRALLVPAYPTSYFASPTSFSASAISYGMMVYAANCTVCHGPEGRGDGPAAASLSVSPADLTGIHLLDHDDGTMFWWLSHGIDAPDGGPPRMPGFAGVLSPDDRWALIDAIRARSAGAALKQLGTWPQPSRAPGFGASCVGRPLHFPDALGGSVALLTIGADPTHASLLLVGADLVPVPCHAEGPEIAAAYAAVAGQPAAALPGWQFLVDSAGWLRAAHGPGVAPDWSNPATLREAATILIARPFAAQGVNPASHQH